MPPSFFPFTPPRFTSHTLHSLCVTLFLPWRLIILYLIIHIVYCVRGYMSGRILDCFVLASCSSYPERLLITFQCLFLYHIPSGCVRMCLNVQEQHPFSSISVIYSLAFCFSFFERPDGKIEFSNRR